MAAESAHQVPGSPGLVRGLGGTHTTTPRVECGVCTTIDGVHVYDSLKYIDGTHRQTAPQEEATARLGTEKDNK